jgi:hypothetical protein
VPADVASHSRRENDDEQEADQSQGSDTCSARRVSCWSHHSTPFAKFIAHHQSKLAIRTEKKRAAAG